MPKTLTPQDPTPEAELRETRDQARQKIITRIQIGEDLHSLIISDVE